MAVCRVLSRVPKNIVVRYRSSVILSSRTQSYLSIQSNHFHSALHSSEKISQLRTMALRTSILQRFGISSSASLQSSEKAKGDTVEDDSAENTKLKGNSKHRHQKEQSASTNPETGFSARLKSTRRRRSMAKSASSDSDKENELSKDELVKLANEKEELLKTKWKEILDFKDKVLRTYAEMENVMNRTKREAENSKKFAIQSFAKSLIDVADTLERASSVVTDSFSKIDVTKDDAGAVPLLKTLLEGVQMTDKQLAEVFNKFGVEKFDPTNEQFDPHRHNAIFQVPDKSKAPGTVAAVLKCGYLLHDRIIRPAEVGVISEEEGGVPN